MVSPIHSASTKLPDTDDIMKVNDLRAWIGARPHVDPT